MKRSMTLLVFFGITLMCMGTLVGWWTLFMKEAINLERQVAMSELQLQTHEAALDLGLDSAPPILAVVPENRGLELVPCNDDAGSHAVPARPAHPDQCVRVSQRAVDRIDRKLDRRQVMVNGEGTFLLTLLAICTFMLYHLSRQERRHTEQMESFFHAATHEMKTPLTGIKTLLETLRAGRIPEGERDHLLALGLKNCHDLEHRIENVLIAGGLKTGRQTAHITTLALSPLLTAFIDHRRRILTGRPEEVRMAEGGVESGLMVQADSDLLRVVLENLVDNGLKYGGDEPLVELNVTRGDNRVHIAVRDWGIGFEPSTREALFSPYRRELGRSGEIQHGTGLGLSIARNLCRKMRGDLEAHSDGPGTGATFTILLPLPSEVVAS